jgi:hypothetical protein
MASAQESLRLWNLNFSCIDAKHDSERITRKTKNPIPGEPDISIVIDSLIKNPLFISSLRLINNRPVKSRDLFNVTGTEVPILNRGEFLKGHEITHGIHDMYSLEGLNQQITPSYYFDSARRHYTNSESINIKEWFRSNGGQKIVDLYEVGAIEIPGSRLTITNNPITQLQFIFNIPNIATYSINIDLIGGWCVDSCSYITSNWEKNSWFTDNVAGGSPQEGLKYLLGKLMGDYLHCILCGPTDVVLTGDSYLRERCVKNNKNVICRYNDKVVGSKYILYKAGAGSGKIIGAAKETVRKFTKGLKERLGFSGKTHAKHGTVAEPEHVDEDSSTKPLTLPEITVTKLKDTIRRSTRISSRIQYQRVKHEGGGLNENTNAAYLSTLIYIIGDRSIKIKQVLDNKTLRINNADYRINDTLKTYLTQLIDFLNSDVLKMLLESIDKSQEPSEYINELSKWVPSNIFYNPSDMATKLDKSETYYTPQQITKIFPYQNDSIGAFKNNFAQDTFFDFVVQSIPELNGLRSDNMIIINYKSDYTDIISYLSEFYQDECNELRKGVNETNNDIFMDLLNRAILYHEFKDLDIVKIIVKGLIEDNLVAARVFDMLINILAFKGIYVYNYKIIIDFINIINNEGGGLEFMDIERLDNILFHYETSDILPEDFIEEVIANKYDASQIEDLIKIVESEFNKPESNPLKRKRINNNNTYRSRTRMNTSTLLSAYAGGRKIKRRTRKNKSRK